MSLNSFERRQAQAILESFAPTSATEGLVPREGEVDYLGSLEFMRAAMHPRAAFGVRLALWIVTFAPIWLGVAFGTMASLPVEKRGAILDRMLASKIFIVRELGLAMKIGASFALMATKSIRARTGWSPDEAHAHSHVPVRGAGAAEPRRARGLPVLRPSRPGAV